MIKIEITGDNANEIASQLKGLTIAFGGSGAVAQTTPGKEKEKTPAATKETAAPAGTGNAIAGEKITVDVLRAAWQVKKDAGAKSAMLKEALAKNGAESITLCPEDKYEALLADLNAIAV